MAKRNRETIIEDVTSEEEVTSTENVADTVEEVKQVEEKPVVKSIEDMSDDELIAYMNERKRKKAEAVAIKEVKIPMYKLVQMSAVKVTESEDLQNQINRLTHEIRSKK